MMSVNVGDRIGAFVIEKEIARSGTAAVYRAYKSRPEQKVAIKIARPSSDRGNVFDDLIRQEAELLTELRHPGIVRIYPMESARKDPIYFDRAVGLPNKPSYLVMEYLSGRTLAQQRAKINRFPLEWRIELFYQLLTIVDYLHLREYAHCDLKPENIILRYEPEEDIVPSVVLIDFGTASKADQLTNDPAGTKPYVAPEVQSVMSGQTSRSTVVPEKADVFSLGVLFFELITGQQAKESPGTGITAMILNQMQAVSDIYPNLAQRGQVDRLLKKMISPNPDERPYVNEIFLFLEERLSCPPRILMNGSSRRLW